MILYDKLIYRYVITTKLRKNLGDINSMRKSLKEIGFTDEEIEVSITEGMKEKRSRIFKLKRDLVKINKK
jgi:hypothetical protein